MSFQISILKPFLAGGSRPADETVDLVVLHSTAGAERDAGSADNAISTLRQRKLSYHYILTKDGSVVKCLPVGMKAYHAGSSYGPHEQKKGISREQDKDGNFTARTCLNGYSVGIAFVNEDNGRDPYTDEQVSSLVELLNLLRKAETKLTVITTHAEVAPIRKIDPFHFDARPLAAKTGFEYWSRA